MPAEPTFAIDAFLEELGFSRRDAKAQARLALIDAGLTNATKRNMAESKRASAIAAITARIAPVCSTPACRAGLELAGRSPVTVDGAGCEVCGGSDIARATRGMVDALVAAGRTRLLVIGGSPNARRELRDAVTGTPVAVSFVEGHRPTGARRARELADGADVVVIWAGTQLDHKVSQPFATAAPAKTFTCARRGVAALAEAVAEHAARAANDARVPTSPSRSG